MTTLEPLQLMGAGMIGAFSPGRTSIPQMIVALILLTAFIVSLWLPIEDESMKSILVGSIGVVIGAYFNDQGHKVTR